MILCFIFLSVLLVMFACSLKHIYTHIILHIMIIHQQKQNKMKNIGKNENLSWLQHIN